MKALLIGNYLPDQQESMQRYAGLLAAELPDQGICAELIRPEARFGKGLSTNAPTLAKYLGYIDKLVLFPFRLRRLARRLSSDGESSAFIHICDHANAHYTSALRKVPVVATCHDLLPIRSARGEFRENPVSRTGKMLQSMIARGLERADHVICVSEATRLDLLRVTRVHPRRCSVVLNGLNYEYRPMPPEQAFNLLAELLPPGNKDARRPIVRFLLHVGGNPWYKNRAGLLRIYHELVRAWPEAPPLVLAGKTLPPDLLAFIRSLGLESRVHSLPGCDNETLRALYSAAELLVFPSLAEGFGWPIAEAMACGCPVLASHVPPMNEVGGKAAWYANPRNTEQFAAKIREILGLPPAIMTARRLDSLEWAARYNPRAMIAAYKVCYAQHIPGLRIGTALSLQDA